MTESRYVPSLDGWLFAVKSFAAAMLAFYIALALGLDRPYWAIATVYIVANPLSGALRSKAVYRMLGTLIGAAATVALVPNLVNAPELLSLALALWVGGCLYLSVLDRTPRSYTFMLAGYTAALIGFPVVTTPDAVWDIAVARVEEIALGIACITIIGTVVLPRPVGPVLRARFVAWRQHADRLAEDAIAPADVGETEIGRARLRLAADAIEIRSLTTYLAYDPSRQRDVTQQVAALAHRMVILLPVLAALRDRLADLRATGGMAPGLEALLAQTRHWIATSAAADTAPTEVAFLRTEIARLQDEADTESGWSSMLLSTALMRLRELVDLRQDCLVLRHDIIAGKGRRITQQLAIRLPDGAPMHRDYEMAGMRAVAMALALVVSCAFWIATAWPEGSQAAALAAVACCFTAARDDPVPSIKGLLIAVAVSAVFTAIGQFAILPQASNLEMLTLAMAAFFVPAGVLAVIPATQKLAGIPIFTAVLLALEESYSADFAAWANGTGAALFGVAVAAVVSALLLPYGAEWSARHRLRAGWTDLAAAARSVKPQERLRLLGVFLDRMGLLAPRMALVAPNDQTTEVAAMTDMRVGINLVDLNARRSEMRPALEALVVAVLNGAAAHFANRATRGAAVPPPETLLHAIDRTLDAVSEAPSGARRDIVLALVGLRRNLFPDAPDYQRPAPADSQPPDPAYQGNAA
ncbi:MAG: FUSC family protein [Methylovirgula sp.]